MSTRPCAVVLFCRTLSSNGYNSTPLLDHLLSLRKEFERIALASLLLEADKVAHCLRPCVAHRGTICQIFADEKFESYQIRTPEVAPRVRLAAA